MIESVASLLDGLRGSRDDADVWRHVNRFGQVYGFGESMMIQTRPYPGGGRATFVSAQCESLKLMVHDYLELGGAELDPLYDIAYAIDQPMTSLLEWFDPSDMTEVELDLFYLPSVQAAPLRVVMPVTASRDETRWSVVFGSDDPSHAVRRQPPDLALLWIASAAAGARISDLAKDPAEAENPLSPRERECLLRLAQGLRIDRIAFHLGLASATVEMHLANARRKVGARTSAEAVATAVLRRYINP